MPGRDFIDFRIGVCAVSSEFACTVDRVAKSSTAVEGGGFDSRLAIALILAVISLVLQLILPAISAWPVSAIPGKQVRAMADGLAVGGCLTDLEYWLYLPPGYRESLPHRWPLLLYLHGAGDRGDDLELVRRHGLPAMIEHGRHFPMVVIAPQCPTTEIWDPIVLLKLIDKVEAQLEIDEDRVYVSGFSMGANGTWCIAEANPRRFAALMPIAGGGKVREVSGVAHIPVWAFHGENDEFVSVEGIKSVIAESRAAGGRARLTVLSGRSHDIAMDVYENPKVIDWIFAQNRRSNEKGG